MKLTKKEIGYLSNRYREATDLSIFNNLTEEPDGNEKINLQKKGILDGDKISDDASKIFLILANAKKSTRLLLQNSGYMVERYSYKFDDKFVLASNDNGIFEFSITDDFSDVVVDVSEFVGMSKIASSNISLILNPDEMILLLLLVDIYRKRELQKYSDCPTKYSAILKSDLIKETEMDYRNGITQILVDNYNFNVPDKNKLEFAINSLVEKKLVVENEGYKLNEELEYIAEIFLIPETIILYETFKTQEDDNLLTVGRLVVTAGIHNIMSFMFDGENIQLDTVSGLQLVTNIEDFLMCPDFENTVEQKEVQTNDNTWQCSCGNINNSKFCSNCGAKRP